MKTELACNSDSSVNNHNIVPPPVKSEETANTIIHRRVVKKEDDGNNENKETQILPRSIDDNYDDWMNGNWCWLLSANTNANSNAINKTRHSKSVVSYTTNHSGALENGDIKNTTKIAATTTTAGILVPATSTTRHRSDDDDGNNNDDEKMKPPPKKKMRQCRRQPINYNDREEEGEGEVEDNNYAYEANNPITNNNNDSSSSSSSSSSSNNKDDDEEGYESWTKGNWCWLLPFPTTVDNTETGRPSTRRIRMAVNTGGDNPYEDGDSGNEDCDTDADNDASTAKSKTRKNKIKYTTWQNKRWDEMFRRLVAYKKENNSTTVPISYEADPKLAGWVSSQREKDMNKNISAVRIRRLNSIRFVWGIFDLVPWMEMYGRLVAYKNEHKSTNVPKEYQADPRLGSWVHAQRKSYSRKVLSTDRIKHLESIDFVWDSYDAQWMKMYSKLVEYKKQNKSTAVPQRCTEDPSLGLWVSTQRSAYNKGKLSGKRLELLNSINFIWSMYAKKAI